MHFKALPWEFNRTHPALISPEKFGVYVFWGFDDKLSSIYLSRMKQWQRKNFSGNAGRFKVFLGEEVTPDFLDHHFRNMGFFSIEESYLILNPENMPASTIADLIGNPLPEMQRYLVFCFSKQSDHWKALESCEHITTMQMLPPAFWQNQNLLNYLIALMNMSLSPEIRNYILDVVPASCSDYIHVLDLLRTNYSSSTHLKIEDVKDLISVRRIDKFELASIFSRKKKSLFMSKICALADDTESLRDLFGFMQGHLLKLSDKAHLQQKVGTGRINNYNKELLSCASLWTRDEIVHDLRMFSQLELATKTKKADLSNELRRLYLKFVFN